MYENTVTRTKCRRRILGIRLFLFDPHITTVYFNFQLLNKGIYAVCLKIAIRFKSETVSDRRWRPLRYRWLDIIQICRRPLVSVTTRFGSILTRENTVRNSNPTVCWTGKMKRARHDASWGLILKVIDTHSNKQKEYSISISTSSR